MSENYLYLTFWSDTHLAENANDNDALGEAKFVQRQRWVKEAKVEVEAAKKAVEAAAVEAARKKVEELEDCKAKAKWKAQEWVAEEAAKKRVSNHSITLVTHWLG
jgi:beta-lactamase superfamily II metal-dependent hydrolase